MTDLESQLLSSRRILLIKQCARTGLRARLLIVRRDIAMDEAAGRVERAKDGQVVAEEIESALAMLECVGLGRFAKVLQLTEAR